MEISFHIPNTNTQFVGDETRPPAQVSWWSFFLNYMGVSFCMLILRACLRFSMTISWKWLMLVLVLRRPSSHLRVLQSSLPGQDFSLHHSSICCYCVLLNHLMNTWLVFSFFHRGRYNVELHLSFLRLQGQANDFKIQYSSVVRLFLLPKVIILFKSYLRDFYLFLAVNGSLVICFVPEQSNQPHTFVVISLDPPIRKGQTLYPHIVMQVKLTFIFPFISIFFLQVGFLIFFTLIFTSVFLYLL